jgi:hypothetical protein
MTTSRAAALLLMFLLAAYYGAGIPFIFWPDSTSYLAASLALIQDGKWVDAGGRSMAYPLFLTLPARMSATALTLVVLQAAIAVVAFIFLRRHLVRMASELLPAGHPIRGRFLNALPLLLAATAGYSALHVLIAAMMPEVLFAALALVAVAATGRVIAQTLNGHVTWGGLILAALAIAAPCLVKPHWILAAPALAVFAGVIFARARWRSGTGTWRYAQAGLALMLPLFILGAMQAPEASWAATQKQNPGIVFGPRTLFCNHLLLIDDALTRHGDVKISLDAKTEAALRAYMKEVRARNTPPWRLLGFDGDQCMYDPALDKLMGTLAPSVSDQRALYLNAVRAAFTTQPLPFAWKATKQMWHGLTLPFARFAQHGTFDAAAYGAAQKALKLSPDFLDGVSIAPCAGVWGCGKSWPILFLRGLSTAALAVLFSGLTVAYVVLATISLARTPVVWRHWTEDRKTAFLAYLAPPLLAILAHNGLIAMVHTFDVWRYSFNLFFVNLAFTFAAGLFWYDEVAAFTRWALTKVRAKVRAAPA